MCSEQKPRSMRTLTARIQSSIYTNRKLRFLLSLLLVSFLYYFATQKSSSSSSSSSSPYISKRFGLGAGDINGELKAALKRKGDGRAAVAIIRVVGLNNNNDNNNENNNNNNANVIGASKENIQYLVQMKSHDYPIEAFRGTVCLLGGNANKDDDTPLDTLLRELNEELHDPTWVPLIDDANVIDDSSLQFTDRPLNNSTNVPMDDVVSSSEIEQSQSQQLESSSSPTVRYLGTTMHFQSSALLKKSNPYAFLCALYEITLRPHQLPPSVLYPRGANVQEGRVVLLTEDQLVKHSKYAWGYEFTMSRYFGRRVGNRQRGTAVSEVEERVRKEDMVWTPEK